MTRDPRPKQRRTLPRAALIPFAFLPLFCWTGHSFAENSQPNRAAADRLFEQGKAALKAGNWELACSQFQQSYDFDASPSTLVKIARCHEHSGDLTATRDDYIRAQTLLASRPAGDKHSHALAAVIATSRESLEARLAWVTIELSPSAVSAVITFDDKPITDISGPVPLNPGRHALAAVAAEYQPHHSEITMAEGEHRNVVIELTPVARPPVADSSVALATPPSTPVETPLPPVPVHATAAPPAPTRELREESSDALSRRQKLAAYLTGTGALLSLGAATYFGIKAHSRVNDAYATNHCDNTDACDRTGLNMLDDARHNQTWTIMLGTGGTLLLGTSIVLLATAPGKLSSPPTQAGKLEFWFSPTGARLGGSW